VTWPISAGDKYDVSIRCAEDVLLPRVREAGANALVLADGFSCRSQIQHGSGRCALHLAEALQMALHGERAAVPSLDDAGNHRLWRAASAVVAGAGLVAGGLLLRRRS
jgi:hypothetical protein